MLKELDELLMEQPDLVMLISRPTVLGVEADTVWEAKLLGLKRIAPSRYTLILFGTKQFYRPLRRTTAVFQYNLYRIIRMSILNKVVLGQRETIYLY